MGMTIARVPARK